MKSLYESILSSVGAGLEGMTNDLKKWFIDGCLKSNTLVTDVNIEKVGDRFDIIIAKKGMTMTAVVELINNNRNTDSSRGNSGRVFRKPRKAQERQGI